MRAGVAPDAGRYQHGELLKGFASLCFMKGDRLSITIPTMTFHFSLRLPIFSYISQSVRVFIMKYWGKYEREKMVSQAMIGSLLGCGEAAWAEDGTGDGGRRAEGRDLVAQRTAQGGL